MTMPTNAAAFIREIEARKNRRHGLAYFEEYMESIGAPHKRLRCIHVAGTNGKGSTVNYIRSMLQSAGYKVGTFTSPYLMTHRDRIRIQDVYIPETTFCALAQAYYDSWVQWDLSMFEIDMVLACCWFVQEQVDIAVFEVGLGGRLDATNILYPLVSVITNIGMDHMELLGDSYAQIAREKAGIIKRGTDVITAETKPECLRIFQRYAKQQHAHCLTLSPITRIRQERNALTFCYRDMADIRLATGARYQCYNAALALEAVRYLRQKGQIEISKEQLYEGLRQAVWLGRFEILRKEPLVLLDGAHNVEGIQALCESLKGMHDLQIICSMLQDKNFEAMLDVLAQISKDITLCHFMNARALSLDRVKRRAHMQLQEDYQQALRQALRKSQPLVITGSLYFISEVRQYLLTEGKALLQ